MQDADYQLSKALLFGATCSQDTIVAGENTEPTALASYIKVLAFFCSLTNVFSVSINAICRVHGLGGIRRFAFAANFDHADEASFAKLQAALKRRANFGAPYQRLSFSRHIRPVRERSRLHGRFVCCQRHAGNICFIRPAADAAQTNTSITLLDLGKNAITCAGVECVVKALLVILSAFLLLIWRSTIVVFDFWGLLRTWKLMNLANQRQSLGLRC